MKKYYYPRTDPQPTKTSLIEALGRVGLGLAVKPEIQSGHKVKVWYAVNRTQHHAIKLDTQLVGIKFKWAHVYQEAVKYVPNFPQWPHKIYS